MIALVSILIVIVIFFGVVITGLLNQIFSEIKEIRKEIKND